MSKLDIYEQVKDCVQTYKNIEFTDLDQPYCNLLHVPFGGVRDYVECRFAAKPIIQVRQDGSVGLDLISDKYSCRLWSAPPVERKFEIMSLDRKIKQWEQEKDI